MSCNNERDFQITKISCESYDFDYSYENTECSNDEICVDGGCNNKIELGDSIDLKWQHYAFFEFKGKNGIILNNFGTNLNENQCDLDILISDNDNLEELRDNIYDGENVESIHINLESNYISEVVFDDLFVTLLEIEDNECKIKLSDDSKGHSCNDADNSELGEGGSYSLDGDDIYEKSSVNFDSENFEDFCISDSIINEFACLDEVLFIKNIDCNEGCNEGACIKKEESILAKTEYDEGGIFNAEIYMKVDEMYSFEVGANKYEIILKSISESNGLPILVEVNGNLRSIDEDEAEGVDGLIILNNEVFLSTREGVDKYVHLFITSNNIFSSTDEIYFKFGDNSYYAKLINNGEIIVDHNGEDKALSLQNFVNANSFEIYLDNVLQNGTEGVTDYNFDEVTFLDPYFNEGENLIDTWFEFLN